MHFLIERIRYLRAWLAWVRSVRQEAAGLEALSADPPSACPIPLPNCETCRPDPVDHRELGRGDLSKTSIAEVAAWLETNGFIGRTFARDGVITVWDDGRRQVYAAWLIKRREAYERGAEVPS